LPSVLQFRVLSDDQCQALYLAAEQCLQRVGVHVYNAEARDLLASAGAEMHGTIVRVPPSIIRDTLDTAPHAFSIWHRDQQRSMPVEADQVNFGPGLTNTDFVDPFTGERRRTRQGDPALTARVCDALENIDYVMGLGLIDDVDPQLAPVYEFAELIANTTKPILAWAYSTENLSTIYEMALAVAGSEETLRRRPTFGFFATFQSPLVNTDEDLANILWAAERGIPVIYLGGPTVGLSSPMTGASSLVIALATALSGLAILQLKHPGAPIALGGTLCPADLRTSRMSYGAPESSLYGAAFADLCRYLRVPFMGTAGASESKLLDSQAAIESAIQLVLATLSGSPLVHDLGFLDGGELGSLTMLVIMDEIIAMIKRFMRGVAVTAETIMPDLLEEVGPGGHFIAEPRSAKLCRQEVWVPKLMDRNDRFTWQLLGASSMEDRARHRLQELLAVHRPEPLGEAATLRISTLLAEAAQRSAADQSSMAAGWAA
jgi:trimethylamine--corrinoid protein Co-methyltransferase